MMKFGNMKLDLYDLMSQVNLEKLMNIRDFRNWNADDVLDLLGLEKKREARDYLLPGIGVFAFGVVVGVGVGMLFAPKEGRQLRDDLSNRVGQGLKGAKDMINERMGSHGEGTHASSSPSSTGSTRPASGRSTIS